ncbi:MAG: glycosyltransferase [Candidatus Dependentiae bacterium]
MKKNIFFITIFVFIQAYAAIDFDASMQIDSYQFQELPIIQELLPLSRRLYATYNLDQVTFQEYEKIPKIMHHVWFGRPLSQEDKALRKTWEDMHPDWRFVLWTDRIDNDPRGIVVHSWQELQNLLLLTDERYIVVDVAPLQFDNRKFFDASRNYGEKSDIIKYEIVYRIGGVYIDCDFECLKPLDPLHHAYDFYTGIQPLDTNYAQLGAALFAAHPGHEILKYAVQTIERDRGFGPIVIRSGPIHFSRAFIARAGIDDSVDIAFPTSFFYPCGYHQKNTTRSSWIQPESFAVHHWAGSWLIPEAFEQ